MKFSEDYDIVLPNIIRDGLSLKWRGTFVGRSMPEATRSPAVLIQRNGGPFLDHLRDQAHVSVNIYGRTEKEANDLAIEVRGILEDQNRRAFKRVEVSGPAPVNDSPLQRYMYVDLIGRRRNL